MAWCKAYYCERGRTIGLWSYTHWPLVSCTAAEQGVHAAGCVRGGGRPAPRLGVWTKREGLHFFEHGIVIRTTSRTDDAACRCEKLLHCFRRGLARGAAPGHGEIRRASIGTCGLVQRGGK